MWNSRKLLPSQPPYLDFLGVFESSSTVYRAGGGGSKSKDRRVKLKVKNEKLRQERERRGVVSARTQQAKSVGGSKPGQKVGREQSDHQDVHPSRRARVGGSK